MTATTAAGGGLPATTFRLAGRFVIDSHEPALAGQLLVERPVEWVRSRDAVKPDPGWEYTDPAGHWHAFADPPDLFDRRPGQVAAAEQLPTLRTRVVDLPCDGSCGGVCGGEGYTATRYDCRACGAPVEPRWIPDMDARERGVPVPGLADWQLVVECDPADLLWLSMGRVVGIRCQVAHVVGFGIGTICNQHIRQPVGGPAVADVQIAAASPWGTRRT